VSEPDPKTTIGAEYWRLRHARLLALSLVTALEATTRSGRCREMTLECAKDRLAQAETIENHIIGR